MNKILPLLVLTLISSQMYAWGPIGHRVVGMVAEDHLTRKAKKNIQKLLGHESLAIASTWMDEVRSDNNYKHMETWHWVTIPPGKLYDETTKNPSGDAIDAIERAIAKLKTDTLSRDKELENVKLLIHLIADIHQPLHVGTGEDHGGNDVNVKWMWKESNLHRVWDSDMINSQKLSYTELAESIDHAGKEQINRWQADPVREWAYESMQLRPSVYDLPDNKAIGYRYRYENYPIVEKRLLQAGIRLAGVLNDIYG